MSDGDNAEKAHRRELFEKYFEISEQMHDLEEQRKVLMRQASDVAEEIHAQYGIGPFKFAGKPYCVRVRKVRASQPRGALPTWYLRGPTNKGTEV